MLSYDEWYDKSGYKKREEIENWLDTVPDSFDVDKFITSDDIDEYLFKEYESQLGEYEDR